MGCISERGEKTEGREKKRFPNQEISRASPQKGSNKNYTRGAKKGHEVLSYFSFLRINYRVFIANFWVVWVMDAICLVTTDWFSCCCIHRLLSQYGKNFQTRLNEKSYKVQTIEGQSEGLQSHPVYI